MKFEILSVPFDKKIFSEILLKSALPSLFIFVSYLIFNWVIVGLWFLGFHEESAGLSSLIIPVLMGIFPILVGIVLSFRIFVRKAMAILQLSYFQPLFTSNIDNLSQYLIEQREYYAVESKLAEIVAEFKQLIKDKVQSWPNFLSRIVNKIISKIALPYKIDQYYIALKNQDKIALSSYLNRLFVEMLEEATKRIVPRYLLLLIPFHIILYFLLFIFV